MLISNEVIRETLSNNLPKSFNIIVRGYDNYSGQDNVQIAFSPTFDTIHDVSGQYPQIVSLNFNRSTMKLTAQTFGGNGGNFIYRKPDQEVPTERYLFMKSIKVPFRQPVKEARFILPKLEKFCKDYLVTVQANRGNLMYQDKVDYSFLDSIKF